MLGITTQDIGTSIGDTVSSAIQHGIDDVFGSIQQIPSSGGLNSKQYDVYRGQVWDVYSLKLFNVVADYRNKGQLTYSGLASYISALQGLMDSFVAGTNKFRMYVKADWIDPRFHDFYDPMVKTLNDWEAELTTLPSDIITSIISGTGMPTPLSSMPVPGVSASQAANVQHPQQSLLGGNTLTYIAIGIGIYLLARKR